MGFIKFDEDRPIRFNEFDEARIYIEDISINKELTLEAIDYMIKHKEYYFLLKNVINQLLDEKDKHKDIIDYLFSRLDICPRRENDIKLYLEIIHSQNKPLKEALLEFLKRNADQCKDMALKLLKSKNNEENLFGFCVLINLPDEDIKEELKKFITGTKNLHFANKFLDYIYFYGEKNDTECLDKLQKQFPQLNEKIKKIKKFFK